MLVNRLGSYKEPSPFRNFSVLAGREENITGNEEFGYALEIPWEDPPICLLTENGLRTTLAEMYTMDSRVGKLRITPLIESDPLIPRVARTPMVTVSVAELLELKKKTSLVALTN